ncbi:hypothetical protein HGM15179_020281, partial [Zosterops borbonicus]
PCGVALGWPLHSLGLPPPAGAGQAALPAPARISSAARRAAAPPPSSAPQPTLCREGGQSFSQGT